MGSLCEQAPGHTFWKVSEGSNIVEKDRDISRRAGEDHEASGRGVGGLICIYSKY